MDPKYFLKLAAREPDFMARKTVRAPHLIIVEGQDDLWFFDELLSTIGCSPDAIQTMDYGGSGQLPLYLENLFKEDAILDGKVKGILVTGDADTYTGNLPYKVNKVVKAIGFNDLSDRSFQDISIATPSRLGLFLVPEKGTAGSLETLLLRTVTNELPVVEARALVEKHHAEVAPRNDKHVGQAYLATKPALARGAGFGAKLGYFNMTDPALDNIKTMIAGLTE